MHRHRDRDDGEEETQPEGLDAPDRRRADPHPEHEKGHDLVTGPHAAAFAMIADIGAEHTIFDELPVEPFRAARVTGRGEQQEDRRWQERYEYAQRAERHEERSA